LKNKTKTYKMSEDKNNKSKDWELTYKYPQLKGPPRNFNFQAWTSREETGKREREKKKTKNVFDDISSTK
jgi:hypothetical protein